MITVVEPVSLNNHLFILIHLLVVNPKDWLKQKLITRPDCESDGSDPH